MLDIEGLKKQCVCVCARARVRAQNRNLDTKYKDLVVIECKLSAARLEKQWLSPSLEINTFWLYIGRLDQ